MVLDIAGDVAISVERGDKTGRALLVEIKRDTQERGNVGVIGAIPYTAFTQEPLIGDDNKNIWQIVRGKIVRCARRAVQI